MMRDKKYCQICGVLISDINAPGTDYYRHIPIKYCDHCRDMMNHLQGAARQRDYRQRKKKIRKLQDERLQLLSEENELLKQYIIRLREQVEKK